MGVDIRPIKEADIPQVHSIYSHYVLNTVLTFLTREPPLQSAVDQFDQFKKRGLPFLVAVEREEDVEHVRGFASAGPFRCHMLGYGPTVELALFLHPEHQSRGLGTRLLSLVMDALKEARHVAGEFIGDPDYEVLAENGEGCRVRQVLAVMAVDTEGKDGGEALRNWYVKRGFVEVGRMHQLGYKMGRWIDVIYLQYTLW